MISVGIDVSKGKSMTAAIKVTEATKMVILEPAEFEHTETGLQQLIHSIKALQKPHLETRAIMEATGHYHEPVASALATAGIFVSVVNPVLVYDYGNNSVRRVKTDRKDALKIARYGLDNWAELREHLPQETVRRQLKIFSRQYNLCIKTVHALENNLISLLDKAFPGANKLFSSQKRKDGRQKWVDFVIAFWHVNIVSQMSESEFILKYQTWCLQNGYQFKPAKAQQVHQASQGHSTTLAQNANTHLLITTAAAGITSVSVNLATIKQELINLAAQLPEHIAVRAMYGVGELTAAQLIAEIGDVRRFHRRSALIAFAGVDPLPQQSGKYEKKSTATSKRGSAPLRKTLFQVVCTHLRHSPEGEPVFQFLDRKRAEGKPYFVYMTAAANKFLRIYYARVREFLLAKR